MIFIDAPAFVKGRVIILELKAVKKFQEMEWGCEAARCQIDEKKYREELRQEGYEDIVAYGICFYQKECVVQR